MMSGIFESQKGIACRAESFPVNQHEPDVKTKSVWRGHSCPRNPVRSNQAERKPHR